MTSRMHGSKRRVAAALALSLLAVGMSACGNAITVHHAGQVGITVDQSGQPVIAVMVCAKATPFVLLAEGRKESDPDTKENVQRGSWQARSGFSGVRMISLVDPSEDWVIRREPGKLQSERLFVVDGGTQEDDDAALIPVSFRLSDLSGLSQDQVRVGEKVEPLTTFGSYRCPQT